MGAAPSTKASEALPSIEDMDLSSQERPDDVMEDPAAVAQEPTTPRGLNSPPAAAEAPKGPCKRGRSARSPVTESPNTRPNEKLRSNPEPALQPVDEDAEPVEDADFVGAAAAGQINVEEDIDIDVVEAGPTAQSFQAMVEDAAEEAASSSDDEDSAGAASDASSENDNWDVLSFEAVSEGLDAGWEAPQQLLAVGSGVGSCSSRGVFGELATYAVGSMTAVSVRGVEPRIVAGVEAADPFDTAEAPKPYKPLKTLVRLSVPHGCDVPAPKPRRAPGGSGRTASHINKAIRIRLDHEASFFLLNIPWLLRAPPCDEPMGPRTSIGPIIIRGERCLGFKVPNVYDLVKDAYRLATAEELTEATPKATRDNPNPPSRHFPNGPHWLQIDEDADAPPLLSREDAELCLLKAHAPDDFSQPTQRDEALRFWRLDVTTNLVRARDAAVLEQAQLPQGCMSILRRAWTKSDGKVKPRLEPDVAQQRAANYLNNNAPSDPYPRPGFDGPLGVAEHVMTYLYGGGPGGDHPDMPLWSLRMLPVRGSPSTTHALKKKLQAFRPVRSQDYRNMDL